MRFTARGLDRIATLVAISLLVMGVIVLFLPGGLGRRALSDWSQERDRRRIVEEEWDQIAGGNTLGGDLNEVTAVMFVDYTCAFCRVAHDTIMEFIRRYPSGAVGIRQRPRTGSEVSRLASMVATCSSEQNGFAMVHSYLLQDEGSLVVPELGLDWERLTSVLGLSEQAMRRCMGSGSTETHVAEDRDLALRLAIRGTPAFLTPDGGVHLGVPTVQQMAEWAGLLGTPRGSADATPGTG